MTPRDCAALVLASGNSARFGVVDKLQADLCGKPVLHHVLDSVSVVGFGQIFVVQQANAPVLPSEFTPILNRDKTRRQGENLRLGLQAVQDEGWKTVCVILGDMPLVTPKNITNLFEKYDGLQSVASLCESTRLPPVLLSLSAIQLVLSQNSSHGAKAIFDLIKPLSVPISSENAIDIDTPADLAKVTAMLRARIS